MERAFAAARAAWGGLDVVVANAATQLIGQDERADRLELAAWQRTVEVNLTGAFLTVKHGARALLASDGGAIVCTGSPAGHYGIAPGLDAYSASKAGVSGLVRVTAIDFAPHGIRVNGVLPGITETPMNHWWLEDDRAREDMAARIPLGRPAQARRGRRRDRVPRLRRGGVRDRRAVGGRRRPHRRLNRSQGQGFALP